MPPNLHTVRRHKWLVWPISFVLSGAVVATASYSAFSDVTSSAPNNWAVGSVDLSGDDGGVALFNATNLKPGSTGTRCIVVSSNGNVASTVKLYGTSASTTKSLGSYLTLAITQGTGGSFGSCTGFTALASGSSLYSGTFDTFASTYTGFGSGLGTWAPTGAATETRTYRFVYTLSSTTPDSTQAGTAGIGFTWEAQSS